jgi:recombination protein RecR
VASHPESVSRLIDAFSRMPGIGARTAERLAQYILRIPEAEALELAEAVRLVKSRVRPCGVCFNMSDRDPCHICADPTRDAATVCVVEQPRDLVAIEETGAYRGLYHVLYGTISPLDGMGPEDLTLEALSDRVARGTVREVILATNPDIEGDGTALFIEKSLRGRGGVKVSRIASGIARGGAIERSSKGALAEALRQRRGLGGRGK